MEIVEISDSSETEDESPIDVTPRMVAGAADRGTSTNADWSQDQKDVVLMEAVLDVWRASQGRGAATMSWDAVAKGYHERLYLQDPADHESPAALKARVDLLHKTYCDRRSNGRDTLTSQLAGLLEQYHRFNPSKRALLRDNDGLGGIKRLCRNPRTEPPSTLFQLDLVQDTRMLREYLNGGFLMFQAEDWKRGLLKSAAATRGTAWSENHVRAQIEWLVRCYHDGDSAPLDEPLRELVEDYTITTTRLVAFHKELNKGVRSTQPRRTLDDVLLQDVYDLKPFREATIEQEGELWGKIALRLNNRLGASVLFTRWICFTRFRLLREAQLAGGTKHSVHITPHQDEWLRKIELLLAIAPQRAPQALPGDFARKDPLPQTQAERVAQPDEPPEGVATSELETNESERTLLTLLLTEVDTHRPFQAGAIETLVWEKIRASVNFGMQSERISSREECRARVVALCNALGGGGKPEVLRQLTAKQVELLRRIATQGGSLDATQQAPREGDGHMEPTPSLVEERPEGRQLPTLARGRDQGRVGRGQVRSTRGRGRPPLISCEHQSFQDMLGRVEQLEQGFSAAVSDVEARLQTFVNGKTDATRAASEHLEQSIHRLESQQCGTLDRVDALSKEIATITRAMKPLAALFSSAVNGPPSNSEAATASRNHQDPTPQ